MMILDLIKSLATIVFFFLLFLGYVEFEFYMNEGYFVDPIKNTTIFFMCWMQALLIFIFGKTAKWYFNYGKENPQASSR